MRRDVEFRVEDGTTLRGYFHVLDAGRAAPCVVMTHGFSGVKEQIDHYAAAFCKAGYAVLVYDHRGFGTSDGTPRLEVDPERQVADWRDAISYASTLPEVDTDHGFAVWGSSFAGGLAIVVAANDDRVKCVVSQIPNVSGHRNSKQMFTAKQRDELLERLRVDREIRRGGGEPAMVPVFTTDDSELCALPPAVQPRFIELSGDGAETWKNEVTLRSVGNMIEFEPAGWVPHLGPKPWLMIVGRKDTCTYPDVQLDVFATAREPKRLAVHPGRHFQTYVKYFEQTAAEAVNWLHEHFPPAV